MAGADSTTAAGVAGSVAALATSVVVADAGSVVDPATSDTRP